MLYFHPVTFCFAILHLVAFIEAYQPSSHHRPSVFNKVNSQHREQTSTVNTVTTIDSVKNTFAALALSTILATTTCFNLSPAVASDAAAQISLDQIPPTSISIQIGDLPVVGSLLSGTYTKVTDGSIKSPSITIKSPKDKVKAISSIATGGHLEFDVGGKVSTHLDVDIAADEAGTAKVVVKSNLIPKLPFKNMASSINGGSIISGGKESQWNIVTNLGNGESYYYNAKSGVTQFARPDKI